MGIFPPTDDFPLGVACGTCTASIFPDGTPLYVEAHVTGIVACPLFPGAQMPNGVFLLTQTAACIWFFASPTFFFTFALTAIDSQFTIGGAGLVFFSSGIAAICQTSFSNQANCAVPATAGSGGSADVFWGPTIGPGP